MSMNLANDNDNKKIPKVAFSQNVLQIPLNTVL